jgi:hypothetical protein
MHENNHFLSVAEKRLQPTERATGRPTLRIAAGHAFHKRAIINEPASFSGLQWEPEWCLIVRAQFQT